MVGVVLQAGKHHKVAMGFNKDLTRGKKIEHEVANYLRKYQGWRGVQVIDGKHSEYDIQSDDGNIEVKYDPMSDKTGNIVIEIEMGGKPSGITTSTADQWCFVDGKYYYFIETDALRSILKGEKWRVREFIGKGDRKKKKAYLLPKSKLDYCPYVQTIERNI